MSYVLLLAASHIGTHKVARSQHEPLEEWKSQMTKYAKLMWRLTPTPTTHGLTMCTARCSSAATLALLRAAAPSFTQRRE